MNLIEKWKNRETKKKLREENERLRDEIKRLSPMRERQFGIAKIPYQKIQGSLKVPQEFNISENAARRQVAYRMLEQIKNYIKLDSYEDLFGLKVYTGTLFIAKGEVDRIMSVKGFDLILNDYCAYCPNFLPEVEKVDIGDCESPHRTLTEIRCENETSCAVIAKNLMDRIRENGKTDA